MRFVPISVVLTYAIYSQREDEMGYWVVGLEVGVALIIGVAIYLSLRK